ncbi:putative F-box/LRR-repeat protein 9 [Aegilops tauschii subsp. strangulata]|nr:F-box protein SKIP19-like [Aegilops tauschii subsp. strangulata]
MGAGFVCHSWLEAAKAPELWRKVDMGRGPRDKEVLEKKGGIDSDDPNHLSKSAQVMCAMAKVAVDRSDGKLEVFVGANFVTDEILNYIGARSPSLKKLALLSCYHVTSEGLYDLVTKCPQLEDIEVSRCTGVRGDAILATGRACPRLKRLVPDKTLRRRWDRKEVAGISLMHELRYLSLARSEITNEELMAVVDACPCLEYLSVVDCYNIVADGALRAKCATVKMLELPTPVWMSSMVVRSSWMSDDYYDSDEHPS